MSNVFVRVCLSLLETIRQRWNSLCSRSRTGREGSEDEDNDALSQTQSKQANVKSVKTIHIEDETRHKKPVQAMHYRYERESQRNYNQARCVDLDEINVEDNTRYKTPIQAKRYKNERELENPVIYVQYEKDVVKSAENIQNKRVFEINDDVVHCKKEHQTPVEHVAIEKELEKTADVVHYEKEQQKPVDEVSYEKKPAKDEFVYRLLRFNENYRNGLRPKNIYSSTSLERHVERGSRGVESRYISCCKTMYGLQCLGNITNQFSRVREVVRINITKLDRSAVKVIDLTDHSIRRRHISYSSPGWGYAQRFEEVILDPTTHVPRECVERIGIVHYRSFIKDDHIKLT